MIKQRYHIIVPALVLSLLNCLAQAQDFRQRLIDMQQSYNKLDTVHLKMSIEVFESEKTSDRFFNETAEVRRASLNYSYQFGSTNMLMNNKCLIVVDHSAREIMYAKRSLESEQALFKDPFKVSMDSILGLYESPQFIGKTADGDHFRILQKTGLVREIDLFIHPEENYMTRIEYRYADKHYVVIRFTLFDRHPVFENGTFDEKKFVSIEKNVLKPSTRFRNYNLGVSEDQ